MLKYCSYKTGTIVEIRNSTSNPDYKYITIAADPNNIYTATILVASQKTLILDKNYNEITLSELNKGDNVFVYHSNIMTLSIPPQTQVYIVEVK